MNKLLLSISALLLACTATFAIAAERVGDFALIDHQGTFHHMAWYDDQEAIVLMVQANGAREIQNSLAAYQALNTQYKDQGVVFMMLNPGLQTERAAVQAEAAAMGIELPILMDDAQLVAESLGVKHIGETVIYNPKSFEIVFRGDSGSLETALEQFLSGQEVQNTAQASGTMIEFPMLAMHEQQVPSYTADVAPIIADNCATCHRADGIAPFALDSHMSAKGWSPMIREVVMTKRMPPGQVDNKVGRKVKNAMNLSDAEMQTLVHWINAGAPVDGDIDPLAQLTWPDSKWQLGEPDLIVQIPATTVPATGIVDYKDIPIELNLDRDVWIKGSEVAPGDPTVLHHIITTVIPPEGAPDFMQILTNILDSLPEEKAQAIRTKLFAAAASGTQPNISEIFAEAPEIDVGAFIGGGTDPNMASIAGYAPGASIEFNPPGTGGLLKAGSSLSLQMHYTTSGKETTDNSEIGIYFYPEGEEPAERMSGGVANAFTINIPAQAKDHEMEITVVVPEEAELYGFMPHMHFRGKRMQFTAVYPDGSEELLVSVPNYSFNWQLRHSLEEPLRVPAGTKIVAKGAFDNSSQNGFNPDPNSPVYWGEQSWEEMFMGFYSWKNVDQGGE